MPARAGANNVTRSRMLACLLAVIVSPSGHDSAITPYQPDLRDTTREDILKEAGYEQIYDVDEIIRRMPTPE